MPLLSKNNQNDNTAMDTSTGGGRHHHGINPNNATGNGAGTGQGTTGQGMTGQGMTGQGMTGQGMTGQGMTGQGYDTDYPAGQPGQNMGTGGTGMMGQQDYDGTNNLGHGQHTHGMSGPGYNNTHGASNMGNMGPNNTGPNATGIPTSNMIDRDGNNTSGGAGSKLTGKIESALGTMVGSAALKNKGLQKQQEANAAKMQSTELSEAERLEHEAMIRRERAVGHGAHPANSQLGAGHTGRGDQDNYQ